MDWSKKMNRALLLGLFVFSATATAGCFEENEPNNNHNQATQNNKHSYSKEAPLFDQGIAGEVAGEDNVDIFYLRTTEPGNDLDLTLIAQTDSEGAACVWAQVKKCTEAGVGNWTTCAEENRHLVADLYTCPWVAVSPAVTTGQLTIGENKLIRIKVERMHQSTTVAFPAATSAKYVLGLVAK